MNSKTIIKRTLPLIIVLVVIIVFAISCSAFSKAKKVPGIENGEEAFLKVKLSTGDEVVITNQRIYDDLKSQSGLNTMVDKLDEQLLKRVLNASANGKSYWDAVTAEEVNKAIEDEIFPDGIEEVEEDEILEKLEDWKDNMFIYYGIKVGDNEVKYESSELKINASTELDRYYRLTLARKAYARAKLGEQQEEEFKKYKEAYQKYLDDLKEYEEKIAAKKNATRPTVPTDSSPVTQSQVTTKFESDNTAKYWALVVPYKTTKEAEDALLQVGVVIKKNSNGTQTWFEYVEKEDGTPQDDDFYSGKLEDESLPKPHELGKYEIMLKLIELYNNAFAGESQGYPNQGDPSKNITLVKGVQYDVKEITKAEYDAIEDEKEKLLYSGLGDKDSDGTYQNYGAVIFKTTAQFTDDELNEDDPLNLLYYTTDRLNSDDTRFGTKLATFIPSLQSANDSDSWTSCFTRTVRSTGDAYVLAVKIAVEEARDVDTLGKFTETVEDENGDDHEVLVVDDETKGFQPEYYEIVEQLLDDAVTTTIINTKMAELRNNCGLIIYDESLESSYTSTYTSDYKNTKKSSKTVVAELKSKDTVEGIEFVGGKFGDEIKVTAQDMFDDLSTKHGVLTAVDAFQFEYMLYSSDNKILDYAKYKSGKKAKDCLLPADESKKDDDDYETPEERWDNIVESVKSTKVAFSSGSYEQYGYPATYGWKNFMKEFFRNYYGVTVNNEEELKIFYLYQEVVSDYSERIAKTDEAKWKNVYIPFMQQKFDDFFSANGVHLLISVTDKEGNISDPNAEDTAWTEIQKTYAEELYQKVFEVLKCTKANEISTVLEQIVDAFDVSPKFVADYEQVTSVQVERTNSSLKYTTTTKTIEIEVAKYKTAGLNVKFEDLGTITQGQMVENFENAVKALWNDRAKDSAQMNKGETDESLAFYDLDFSDGEYLCTEYGYHVLTVTSFTARTTANESVTTTGDDGTESTKTEATIVKPLSLKDLEDIISVYENDTEDIDDTYQLSQISNFFTNIKSDFTSSYYYQYTIMNEFLNIIDSFEFNGVGKEDASRIVSYYKDTYCTSMTYIKNDYDTAINLMKIAANAATLNNCDAETLSIIKEAAQAAMAKVSSTDQAKKAYVEAKEKFDKAFA